MVPTTFQMALFNIFGADEINGATVGAPSRTKTHQMRQQGAPEEQNVALFAKISAIKCSKRGPFANEGQ